MAEPSIKPAARKRGFRMVRQRFSLQRSRGNLDLLHGGAQALETAVRQFAVWWILENQILGVERQG